MSQGVISLTRRNNGISTLLFRYNKSHRKYLTKTFRSFSVDAAKGGPKRPQQSNDLFRVAIVGAGSAGLSTALHLAPLVHKGLIAPIDVFETSSLEGYVHPHDKDTSYDEDFHPGSGAVGRDIGVGIWSTALKPFAQAKRTMENCQDDSLKNIWSTHVELIQKLEKMGKWVGKVGYTTPDGRFLTKSELNTKGFSKAFSNKRISSEENKENDKVLRFGDVPGLLFLREKDFLLALREAVFREEREFGTINTHYGKPEKNGSNTTVDGIYIPSANISAASLTMDPAFREISGRLIFADGSLSPESSPYQLVLAADGLNSVLRSHYAGHVALKNQWKRIKRSPGSEVALQQSEQWEHEQHDETNAIDDRKYTVFRGNSPLSTEDVGMNDVSFQTWGEGKSMRFAAVSMSHPKSTKYLDGEREEKHVWFATTSDKRIASNRDPEERKKLLLKAFKKWHNPIAQLIESTPAHQILMEHGVAHKHSVNPVLNLSEILKYEQTVSEIQEGKAFPSFNGVRGEEGYGSGPIIMFVGDASMTIDPVLAQGFTVGMESSADLAKTLERCFEKKSRGDNAELSGVTSFLGLFKLHKELKSRSERRIGRNLCLLRATELVQSLAQPHSGTFLGSLSKVIIRPIMRLTPDFLQKPIFTMMMKYSLGMYGDYSLADSPKNHNERKNESKDR